MHIESTDYFFSIDGFAICIQQPKSGRGSRNKEQGTTSSMMQVVRSKIQSVNSEIGTALPEFSSFA